MRRYGIQPMAMISHIDHFADVAAVEIGRWLWRHRSELAPVAVAAVLDLAAWLTHTRFPGWWPAIAACGALAAVGAIAGGVRTGLATLEERIYAATLTATAAGWLAAATVIGPRLAPLPLGKWFVSEGGAHP
jgi:hypothetical protein